MLRLKDNQESAYRVTGYFIDGTTSMDEVTIGTLEEAIATAQVEWCEEQDMARVYNAESMATLAEINRDGTIILALLSGWQVEVA
jgi:hypothetical protein